MQRSDDLKTKLSGVFVPLVTPFNKEEIMYDNLRENIRKLNKTALRGYLALGSNGEFKSLSREEKEKVLKTVIETAGEDRTILAGAGAESVQETVELTGMAGELGAHFAAVLTPHYFGRKIPDSGLIAFYRKVAEASKLPVLLYSAPGFTGIGLSQNVVKTLADHPNIVGIKDSSSSDIKDYAAVLSEKFYVMAGTITIFLDALSLGAIGGVLSMANYLPEACVNLFQLIISGDTERAEALNSKLVELNKSISGKFSVAGVKAAMDMVGYFGGEPRLPLQTLDTAQREVIRDGLQQSGLK